ncbi:MAG TPA: hypothetical protein ENG87_05795 [Candidatus Pacearchaeota archaeon]|nr:hypothetical protein [Candidatus Pacearchaeota archaeon]HDZ60175.1 hypothetical protein [Candidatus Pacearchaeota archaeon]
MTEEKETKEEKKKVEGYQVVNVPTEHRLAIQTPEGEVISFEQLLVDVANDIKEIKKGLVG